MAFVTQFHNELGNFLRHGFRMALKTREAFFNIVRRPPLVEGLSDIPDSRQT